MQVEVILSQLSSLDIQEYYYAGNVIDYALLLPPSLERSPYQVLSCSLCVFLQIEGVHNPGNIDVLQELPNAVTGYDDYFVFFGEVVLTHLWLSIAANRVSNCVSERAGHCKAWHILCLEPHSEWSQRISMLVSVGVDSTVVSKDSLCLALVVRLVVPC